MTKINNIVLTPLQKCFEKKALNFFIGPCVKILILKNLITR